jgi:hypothetical protein
MSQSKCRLRLLFNKKDGSQKRGGCLPSLRRMKSMSQLSKKRRSLSKKKIRVQKSKYKKRIHLNH